MKKRDLLIPIVMLTIGAGVGFLARDRQQAVTEIVAPAASGQGGLDSGQSDAANAAGSDVADTDTTTGDNTTAEVASGSAAASAPAVAAPLPPLGAKVADIYADLSERAARGDGRAACRLAAELQQCADRDFMLQGADRAAQMLGEQGRRGTDANAEQSGWESRRQQFAQQQIDFALELDERCKGVSETQLADHADLWRRAALSGHVPSMVHYAKGDGFRMRATLDNLERLATYKSEAERIMRAAAAAGSAEAVQQLSGAYADSRNPWSGLLQQAIKPDVVEAQAISQLASERNLPPAGEGRERQRWNRQSEPAPSSEPQLSGEQMAAAQQRAAKLRQQWPHTEPLADSRLSPWERMQKSRESCERDQFTTLR